MSIKIKSALLCDLIRTENTGKNILVGVYNASIDFDVFPLIFTPSVWVEIENPDKNKTTLADIKTEFPGQKNPKPFTGELPASPHDTIIIQMGLAPLEITGPGFFKMFIRQHGQKRWIQFLSKEIRLKAAASSAS